MSKLKTNTIRHVDGSNDNITLDSSQNVTVEGVLKTDSLRHTGASSDAVTLASDGTCTAKITNNLSNRNLIINGAMQVAQRGTSSTSVGYHTVDRFRNNTSGTDEAITQAQHALTSSDTGPWEKGFRYSYHLTNGNQTGGAGAADKCLIYTNLEAQDLANSGWNYTSASSYITLSFWVKSSVAQNFYGYIYSYDGTPQNYPIETGSLSANTWTKITKKIPGNANLQFDNNNEGGFFIGLYAYTGTNETGSVSLDTWAAYSSSARTPDQTSTWWTTNDATFEITGVQLEVGDIATDFEHRSYGDELARCQRYYYLHADGSTADSANGAPVASTSNYSGTLAMGVVHFPVTMRSFPTIDAVTGTNYFRVYANGTSDQFDTVSLQQSSPQGYIVQFSGNLSVTQGHGSWVQTNNASAKIAFSAEL